MIGRGVKDYPQFPKELHVFKDGKKVEVNFMLQTNSNHPSNFDEVGRIAKHCIGFHITKSWNKKLDNLHDSSGD